MDFAADAVFDTVAPQPRPANARPARMDESAPSFDDHLEAASTEEPHASETPAAPTEKTEASEKASGKEVEAGDQPLIAQPPPPQPAPQFVVQIVAPDAPVTAAAEPAPDLDVAASAPTNAAPAAPAPPPPAPLDAEPAGTIADGPNTQSAQPKADDDTPKAAAPAPSVDAPGVAPPAPVQGSAATPPTQVNAAPISAEATQAIAAIAAPTAPTTQAVAKDETPRIAKSDSSAKGETEFRPDTNAVAAQPPAARATPKSDSAPQGNKDTSIAAGALGAPAADAPEAATPTPQPTAISTPAAAQTQHATLDTSVQRAPPATAQVAREIVKRFNGDSTTFEMRLDPPELGRVEVRLEVSRDHRVTAVLSADSPQALTELARHARDLEQMLQSSGLELTENGLSFDLRQGSEDAETDNASSNPRGSAGDEDAPQQQTTTARPLGYERWRGVRVDVMV